MSTPEVTRCPDGHLRRVIYGLGPYIADYPEQVLAACIVQGWCPTCPRRPRDFDEIGNAGRRTRLHTELLIEGFDPDVLWDDWGIVSNVIVSSFRRSEIS